MEKNYLLSLGYGVFALASVGLFTFSIEAIKKKAMEFVRKTNCK